MNRIKDKGAQVLFTNQHLKTALLFCLKVINNLNEFKTSSNAVIANHYDNCWDDVKKKVYTLRVFN